MTSGIGDDLPADRCERCGAAFHCGADDSTPCECTTVKLADDTLAMLRARYRRCLCMRCLRELAGAPADPIGE